jgi:L-ascorbate metabolism protein UlaG (beta-lactamase superfamily)
VAHLGDLRRVPSQGEIEALGNVKIALVPVGGGGGLSPTKAVEVVSLLEPEIVIPMHYFTPGLNLKLSPVARFLKEMGTGEAEVQPTLKITRGTGFEDTRVVVLSQAQS